MHQKQIISLVVAFLLGVLFTLAIAPRNHQRYVPFGEIEILDTKNGRLYVKGGFKSTWILSRYKVGVEK
jgi:hypothetical protein